MRANEFVKEADDATNDTIQPATQQGQNKTLRANFSKKTTTDANRQFKGVTPPVDIRGWFKSGPLKYLLDKNERARKAGEAEIRKFTNQHMRTFTKLMGRYRKNWPDLTMHVMYQYMRLTMHLNDDDIVHIINNITGKQYSLQDIQDEDNRHRIALNGERSQKMAEEIVASGAIRQLERHWEQQTNSDTMQYGQKQSTQARNNTTNTNTTNTNTTNTNTTNTVDVTPIVSGTNEPIQIGDEIIRPNNPNYKTIAAAIRSAEEHPIREFSELDGNLIDMIESATGGSTSSGSIASVANPMGSVISRTPNLFGYIPAEPARAVNKRKNRRKNAR